MTKTKTNDAVAAAEEATVDQAEDLYARLELLAKALESSGLIDQREHPDAYATLLDAMNFVLRDVVATWQST